MTSTAGFARDPAVHFHPASFAQNMKATIAVRSSRRRKTWREKLADDKNLPRVIKLDAAAAARWGGRTLVIPAPREIDALMRRVPRGQLTTINELRAAVARQHHVASACPITSGIFSWIAAHAAVEAEAAGENTTTPYWRTLKTKGELNPKYPGGVAALTIRLEAEGHHVVQKGKRFFVRDFARHLAQL
jgi:hypothetical protein